MLTDHDHVEFPNEQEVWIRPPPPIPTPNDQHAAGVAAMLESQGRLGRKPNGDVFQTSDYDDSTAAQERTDLGNQWNSVGCPGSPGYSRGTKGYLID